MKRQKTIDSFKEKVLTIVSSIKKGSTFSYKQVAKRAGNPHAARAVGSILKKNYDPTIPCHRVIHSDGSIGDYNRGKRQKMILLKKEGAITYP